MYVLDGFEGSQENKVCKLLKALYDFRQGLKSWYESIDTYLTQHGIQKSTVNSNMFYSIVDSKYAIVVFYVNDLLLVGDNHDEHNRIKSILTRKFDMTILGDAKLYLGAELKQTNIGIYLHQRRFILKLLAKFNVDTCNAVLPSMALGYIGLPQNKFCDI